MGAGKNAVKPHLARAACRRFRKTLSEPGPHAGGMGQEFVAGFVPSIEAQRILSLYKVESQERTRLDGELRRLEAKVRMAAEEERRRIGRELHDEAGQNLVLLRLQLEMLERSAPPEFAAALKEARASVERTVEELRRIVAALSPSVLERLGLRAGIRHLAERFRRAQTCALHLRIDGRCDGLDADVQRVVYRVAQESLSNIAKHSGASEARLRLRLSNAALTMWISDNGTGDVPNEAPDGFGLWGMRERAALLGGSVRIESSRCRGTTIKLSIPCRKHVTADVENTITDN